MKNSIQYLNSSLIKLTSRIIIFIVMMIGLYSVANVQYDHRYLILSTWNSQASNSGETSVASSRSELHVTTAFDSSIVTVRTADNVIYNSTFVAYKADSEISY